MRKATTDPDSIGGQGKPGRFRYQAAGSENENELPPIAMIDYGLREGRIMSNTDPRPSDIGDRYLSPLPENARLPPFRAPQQSTNSKSTRTAMVGFVRIGRA